MAKSIINVDEYFILVNLLDSCTKKDTDLDERNKVVRGKDFRGKSEGLHLRALRKHCFQACALSVRSICMQISFSTSIVTIQA